MLSIIIILLNILNSQEKQKENTQFQK